MLKRVDVRAAVCAHAKLVNDTDSVSILAFRVFTSDDGLQLYTFIIRTPSSASFHAQPKVPIAKQSKSEQLR